MDSNLEVIAAGFEKRADAWTQLIQLEPTVKAQHGRILKQLQTLHTQQHALRQTTKADGARTSSNVKYSRHDHCGKRSTFDVSKGDAAIDRKQLLQQRTPKAQCTSEKQAGATNSTSPQQHVLASHTLHEQHPQQQAHTAVSGLDYYQETASIVTEKAYNTTNSLQSTALLTCTSTSEVSSTSAAFPAIERVLSRKQHLMTLSQQLRIKPSHTVNMQQHVDSTGKHRTSPDHPNPNTRSSIIYLGAYSAEHNADAELQTVNTNSQSSNTVTTVSSNLPADQPPSVRLQVAAAPACDYSDVVRMQTSGLPAQKQNQFNTHFRKAKKQLVCPTNQGHDKQHCQQGQQIHALKALKIWRAKRQTAAIKIQAVVRGYLCRQHVLWEAKLQAAIDSMAYQKQCRCFMVWRNWVSTRCKCWHRYARLVDKYGAAAHGHFGRSFNGYKVLQEGGRYAYAAAWCSWRSLATTWLAWVLLAKAPPAMSRHSQKPTFDDEASDCDGLSAS